MLERRVLGKAAVPWCHINSGAALVRMHTYRDHDTPPTPSLAIALTFGPTPTLYPELPRLVPCIRLRPRPRPHLYIPPSHLAPSNQPMLRNSNLARVRLYPHEGT